MEKTKGEKGITLLALIITVVIMIILAAVTINVTLGDGGLVDQAKWAAEQTANSTQSEQEQIENVASQINDIIAGIGSGGGDTNSVETNSVETNSVEETNTIDTNSVEETNTIDPEPDPIPDGTITIGDPQWNGDGTANVSVISSESEYIIQYQINGTDEGSWLTVSNGVVTGVQHGDTVYARLTDGEQYSTPQNKKIEDTTGPQVTVTAQGSPTTNSITVTAVARDNESGMKDSLTYTYYIKQSTESESSYKAPSGAENISNAQYTFTGLTQNTSYDIKVEVNGDKANNVGTGKLTNQTTQTVPGADEGLETGNITASPVTWENEKASTTLTTTTSFRIQYQINTVNEESWSEAAASPVTVSNLDHGNTVYARLTDGTNAGDYAAINIVDSGDPTVSVEIGEVTETSVEVSVSASDKESGLATSGTYKYYLNDEEKHTGTETSYTFTGLTGGTDYTIKVEAYDKAGRKGTDTKQATTEEASIPDSETQVANYADVDGNGTVDGVIYADLAIGGSGQWGDSNLTYTIPKGSNFKKYKVTQESYSGSFGTGKVIAPITGSSGNERFYVMSLSDVDSSTHYWYYSAYGNMNDYSSTTSEAFGQGEQNTINMIAKWNSSAYGYQTTTGYFPDIWGLSAVNSRTWNGLSGWYVPSSGEWVVFAGQLNITSSNYSGKGLSNYYWSSTQAGRNYAWSIGIMSENASFTNVNSDGSVRLGTTF